MELQSGEPGKSGETSIVPESDKQESVLKAAKVVLHAFEDWSCANDFD